jgi:hypothetical protein
MFDTFSSMSIYVYLYVLQCGNHPSLAASSFSVMGAVFSAATACCFSTIKHGSGLGIRMDYLQSVSCSLRTGSHDPFTLS